MTKESRELIEKAEQSISAAELLMKEGYFDFSASRAYYAMFYAIEALLLSREQAFSKHSAVIAAFGKEFVKSGIFDNHFHHYLLNAFDLRNAGDYGILHAVSKEKARQTIGQGHELISAVKQYLSG